MADELQGTDLADPTGTHKFVLWDAASRIYHATNGWEAPIDSHSAGYGVSATRLTATSDFKADLPAGAAALAVRCDLYAWTGTLSASVATSRQALGSEVAIAAAVRTNLATELGRIDVAVSSRATPGDVSTTSPAITVEGDSFSVTDA